MTSSTSLKINGIFNKIQKIQILSRENSRMLNYSYVHSVMTDGIIYYIHMRELGMLCF
jgi:hypothetical protein